MVLAFPGQPAHDRGTDQFGDPPHYQSERRVDSHCNKNRRADHFPPNRARPINEGVAPSEHEERFPPTKLSRRYRFRKPPFADQSDVGFWVGL
jgi:hypothetical protein